MQSLKKLAAFVVPALLILASCETPEKQNPDPVGTDLENITENTILKNIVEDPALADYVVDEDIKVIAELTIEPGVVIAFAEDAMLHVDSEGTLIAKGSAEKKIIFRGKSVNNDGYWKGVIINSNSNSNEISHAEILNAGSIQSIDGIKANLSVLTNARLTLKHTLISQGGGHGLYLRGGSRLAAFEANTFSNNKEAVIRLVADNIPKLDTASIFNAGNGINAVEVERSVIDGTGEVVWPALKGNTPYRFLERVDSKIGWKLSPGVHIEVAEDEYFDVNSGGYLSAIGTPEKKIIITGVVKNPGSWNGIVINTRSSLNVMENVEISFAGGSPLISDTKSSIAILGNTSASLQIKNSKITNSAGYGIHVWGESATINGDVETTNTFSSNTLAPVFYDF